MTAARSGQAGSEPYSDLPPAERYSQHRASAKLLSGDAAWLHRVAAATGADESLAAALESAARISGPAGPDAPGPAQLLEWASELSAHPRERERRLLLAALQHTCAGTSGSARLWARVEACPPSALRDCALAGRAITEDRLIDAEFQLDRALTRADARSEEVLAITHGLRAALYSSAALGRETVAEAAAALATGLADLGIERWLNRLLAAGRCYAEGPRAALDTLSRSAVPQAAADQPQEPATLIAAGCYQVLTGQPREAISGLSPLTTADAQVAPDLLAGAQLWLALARQLLGDWRLAADSAIAALRTSEGLGPGREVAPRVLCSVLAAYQGEWNTAAGHLRRARNLDGSGRPDNAVLLGIAEAEIARARGELLADNPGLIRLADTRDAARKYRAWWLPLQAEAFLESQRDHDAAAALSELEELADQVPYLRVAHCRLSGRLAELRLDPVAARHHYLAGQNLPPECLVAPFQLGLLEQSYGRLLCGLGDTAEGAQSMERARQHLASAGAIPYARRCAADLAAQRHLPDTGAEPGLLTERERVVARLVAAGLTNPEVAARLYISARTVEYHLAQIYGKLGIRSRRQLGQADHPDRSPVP